MMRWISIVTLVACSGATPRSRPDDRDTTQALVVSTSDAKVPKLGTIQDVAEVRVGPFVEAHAGCVRRMDGSVACWGGPNLLRHFDRQRTEPVPGPTPIAGIADAVSLAISPFQHCARLRSGGATCWQGDGPPAPVTLANVKEIEPAGHHVCALLGDGTVQCRGQNINGELGIEIASEPFGPKTHDWRAVPGATKIAHVVGGDGLCGLRGDGRLYCWGPHPFRPVTTTRDEFVASAKPALVPGIAGVRRMAIGGMPCLVLAKDVRCIRGNDGSKPYVLEVVPLGVAVDDIVDLDVSSTTVCAVTRNGAVTCWGPPPGPYSRDAIAWDKIVRAGYKAARTLPGITNAIQISVGETHACVATATREARCWGDNQYGQLGDGTLVARNDASRVAWFHPDLMPGPGEGLYGCKPAPDVQRTCKTLGAQCALEPPPGYWSTGPGQGTACDQRCQEQILAELKRRQIPACMCTCSAEYQRLEADAERRGPKEAPP